MIDTGARVGAGARHSGSRDLSKRIDTTDLVGGGLVAVIGLAFLAGSFAYEIGTPQRMGPGFLPMVVAGITTVLGGLVMLNAVGREGGLPRPQVRPAAAVLAGIGAFAGLLEPFGLVPAAVALVLVSSLGDPELRLRRAAILAVVVAAGLWVIFAELLGLPFHAVRLP